MKMEGKDGGKGWEKNRISTGREHGVKITESSLSVRGFGFGCSSS